MELFPASKHGNFKKRRPWGPVKGENDFGNDLLPNLVPKAESQFR